MITRAGLIAYSRAMEEFFYEQTSTEQGGGNVYAGAGGNDTVVNYANGTVIVTGAGQDAITSVAGGVVIDSQDDEDTIIAVGNGTVINAGDGNDEVYSQGTNNKITIGRGNDTVYVTGDSPEFTDWGKYDDADILSTPGFIFEYVKDQGLILDPRFRYDATEDEYEEEEE